MAEESEKLLYSSKPGFWYYCLVLFFPSIFFFVDDSKALLFEPWDKSAGAYALNSSFLFMCFGIPVLLLLFRREVKVYTDRVEVLKPALKSLKTYHLADLVKWDARTMYIPKAGRQAHLGLRFKNKKLTFNKVELSEFDALTKLLEDNYPDKKKA